MKKLVGFWERQAWVDKLGDRNRPKLEDALEATGNKQRVADLLNGVWLGHPLHPLLVSLPLGALTTAAMLDTVSMLTGGKSRSATVVIAVGLAGALPAAATGAAEWRHIYDNKARIGLGHAMLNSAALTCYGVSLLNRLGGGSGRVPAMLGFGLLSAAGYLGGHLAYSEQVGVRHLPHAEAPEDFTPVEGDVSVNGNELKRAEVAGVPMLLGRVGGKLCAVSDLCTHLGYSLADGFRKGDDVVCMYHGSRFRLVDGGVTAGPATMPLPTYDAAERDGHIEVRAKTTDS